MLRNLFAAEWLKLRTWPVAWGLLATFLALMTLSLGLWVMVVALHEGLIGGMRVTTMSEMQIAEIKRQLSFPGIFGEVLGQINGPGGFLAIFLAAGSLGGDFGWGTLRSLLARAPGRGTYLLAKLLALLTGLLVAVLIALTVGALIALAASAWLGLSMQLSARDLLALPVGVGRSLFVILPYLLATMACAAWGRSVLAGAGGGLIFLALDVGAGSLGSLGKVSDLTLFMVNLLLQPNINTLVVQNGQLFGLDRAILTPALNLALLPSPAQAIAVITGYCLLFGYGAWRWLTRRDIGGAQ